MGLGKPVDPEEWMIIACFAFSFWVSYERVKTGASVCWVEYSSCASISTADTSRSFCTEASSGWKCDVVSTVEHCVNSSKRASAGVASLVERSKTA
jgi:hypothetical protein